MSKFKPGAGEDVIMLAYHATSLVAHLGFIAVAGAASILCDTACLLGEGIRDIAKNSGKNDGKKH